MENTKITRRSLLRSTATLTTVVVAAGTITAGGVAEPSKQDASVAPPDHDPATGEVLDRERHHHWDTV